MHVLNTSRIAERGGRRSETVLSRPRVSSSADRRGGFPTAQRVPNTCRASEGEWD